MSPGRSVAAALVIGLVIGFCVGAFWGSTAITAPDGDGPVEPAASGGFDAEAAGRLKRIEAWLERAAREPETPPSGALDAPQIRSGRTELVSADSSREEILAALAGLELLVREEGRSTRALFGSESETKAVLDRIRDAERPADWAAWAPILALWRQDPEAARAEVKLLTDQEVLDRFGTPTDVWSVDQGITWQYARDKDPVDASYGTEIILRVPKGYVTQLAVRGRDF